MCGIGAVWGPGNDREAKLGEILSAMKHRGNSLYEISNTGSCALGANRLEIVDKGNGRQPKKNEDGTVYAVLNGEVLNHKELKKELVERGHKFESDCDTEVLVHLYEEYGEGMLEKIDSEMFAFVVYDSKKNELFAARDRWGVKPLYWAQEGEEYYFSSEIKGLAGLGRIARVKLFPPGHYFKNGEIRRYYKPSFEVKGEMSEEDAAKKLRELFDEAVRKRVDTDLPIGVFLSGGLDSTAILATAIKYHKDIVAIIAGKKDSEDVRFARRYCEENGVKHVVREPPSEKEMFKGIEEIIYMVESFEPNVVRQSAISYFMAKAAKELGLRIVLCGEGADELFLGYPEFKQLGKRKITEAQGSFLNSLHRTQFQRVDRISMNFTIEVRVPFFDERIVEFANSLPLGLKIREENGSKVDKYVLREAMQDRLPEYIRNRRKVVLSEGAGYGGNQSGGLFEELASEKVSDEEFERIRREFVEWNIRTKEEALYFSIFRRFGFDKALFNRKRVVANRSASAAGVSAVERLMRMMEKSDFSIFKPRQEGRMKEIVNECVRRNKPIKLFMLWGVWKKSGLDSADFEAIRIIEELLSRIKEFHKPGANLTIILTDSHAELNGVERKDIYGYDSYMANLERYVRSRGHSTKRLSEILWKTEGTEIENEAEKIEGSEVWKNFVSSAERYYAGEDKLGGARKYVRRRLSEKSELERMFKGSIFLTYNGPRYDVLAPNLPTLYIISNRRRESRKPWFS